MTNNPFDNFNSFDIKTAEVENKQRVITVIESDDERKIKAKIDAVYALTGWRPREGEPWCCADNPTLWQSLGGDDEWDSYSG